MKRTLVLFILAAMVVATTALWLFMSGGVSGKSLLENLHIPVIFLVVAFAVFVGYTRLRSHRRHEPAEDELSRMILLRTAALSYYISLYWWVFLLFIKDRVVVETEVLLGTGILGMAVAFAGAWLFFYFRGVRE